MPRLAVLCGFFFLMIRRPPRSTLDRSSAASDVYKRQAGWVGDAKGGQHELKFEAVVEKDGDARRRGQRVDCLLYTSPSPRDRTRSRMPSSA